MDPFIREAAERAKEATRAEATAKAEAAAQRAKMLGGVGQGHAWLCMGECRRELVTGTLTTQSHITLRDRMRGRYSAMLVIIYHPYKMAYKSPLCHTRVFLQQCV